MKHQMSTTNRNNNFKENIAMFLIFVLSIVFLILIDNIDRYRLFVHAIQAGFLISIGIIELNTMKFNQYRLPTFLGIVCTITGILEIIYSIFILNSVQTMFLSNIAIVIGFIVSTLPIIAIYLGCDSIDEYKDIILDLKMIVNIVIGGMLVFIVLMNILKIINANNITLYQRYYYIEILQAIVIAILCSKIYKKIKLHKEDLNNDENKLFKKIVIIILFSTIPTLMHPIIKNFYIEDIISKVLVNISIYFLYRYIVNSNVKNPYKELNKIREDLTIKSNNLRKNNSKLFEEARKIKDLKKMLADENVKLKSVLDTSINCVIVFSKNKEISYYNNTYNSYFA